MWHDEGSKPIEVTVPMQNIVRLLRENYRAEDYVILKIDVEGLEYDILKQILVQGTRMNFYFLIMFLFLLSNNLCCRVVLLIILFFV